jgi:diguanylate cyclase (GGDEF)-like protein/PAS domain S-box-containing protein
MDLARRFRYSTTLVAALRVEDGAFADVNERFEQVTGYARDQIIGRMPLEVGLWTGPEMRARIWQGLRVERRIRAQRIEFRCRDGALRAGAIDAEYLEHEGTAYVLCFVCEDAAVAPSISQEEPDRDGYRSLFHAAIEGIYRSLPGGGFIDVNPAMARMFGFDSPAHMIRAMGRDATRLYCDPGHAESVHRRLAREGRIENDVTQARRLDGETIWISENSRAVVDERGEVLFYEGTIVDISARLEAERSLRESEALYKVLVENCRDGVFLVQSGRIVFCNAALAGMLRYGVADLVGQDYMDFVAPEDRAAQTSRRDARSAGSHDTQRYEVRMVRRDGARALFAVHADAVLYRGDLASTGVMRDITEERRQHDALRLAESKYRQLFEESPTGLFQTHPDGYILEANLALAQMLGYETPEALKGAIPHMLAVYVDPADRERLIDQLRQRGRFDREICPLRHRGGSTVWAEVSARVVRDEARTAAHFEGSVQDVTARREAELAVQRSEAKYRSLVEYGQAGVFIMSGEHFTYVNRAFAHMLRCSERDLIGASYRDLIAPEYLDAADARYARRKRGELVPAEHETCMMRRDGTRVFVSISVGPVELDGVPHMTGTVRDVTRRHQAEQRLAFNAWHDTLTGLPNRALFQARLEERIALARAGGRMDYALLFLDVDGFKLVNDSLGHAIGDELLIGIATRLTDALAGEVLIARYGGDEFTLLPNGACDRVRAEALARQVLRQFDQAFDIGGQKIYTGTSIGVVLADDRYHSPDEVLRDADTAMYRAKARGKADFAVFDEAMHRAARTRFQLELELRAALQRNEFVVHYQPIVRLSDRNIVAFEALVRWQHPVRGLLAPAEFLAIAEESGLIAQLDWWVLDHVCAQLARWRALGGRCAHLQANVNLDERQLMDPGMVDGVRACLTRSGLAADALALEVTEGVFRFGRAQATQTLADLKALGVSLVVDDFGTGYSSLDSFASSPFDALKIDRSFISDMTSNRRHRAIVRTITAFAADLGLTLTAEGVERADQLSVLSELGCQTAQGYLFAAPLPQARFAALLGQPHQA